MGLSLTLQHGDSVKIGDDVVVRLYKVAHQPVRLFVEAPSSMRIERIHLTIEERNKLRKKEDKNGVGK